MAIHEFTLILDRIPNIAELDQLFEVGLDDATPETRGGRGVLNVAREADTLSQAIFSAVEDVERAGFQVVGIEDEDLVTLKTIAGRLDRTYESVRLLANGERGPGGFPVPLSNEGWALYSWVEVSTWCSVAFGLATTVSENERVLVAADHLLRARRLVDAPIFDEFARLSRTTI